VSDPYFSPEVSGFYKFKVNVQRECYGDTVIIMNIYVVPGPVALFEVESAIGCSPFTAKFTNLSDTTRAVENYWNFDTRYNTVVHQSTLSNPFDWSFPENLTDTVQEYTVRLTVKGAFGMCANTEEKIIRVKPNVQAGFTADVDIGCNPLPVHFADTSKGVIDSLSTYWDFGNYQHTYVANPSHIFENIGDVNKTYDVKLIAFTKFGCSDTAVLPITVHPYIKATYTADRLTSCSPITSTINPSGSMGVDTFKWHVYDQSGSIVDSLFEAFTAGSFVISHSNVSRPVPDTLTINMFGVNEYGCADTAVTRQLVVYPEVNAEMIVSEDEICDSVNISFANNSTGYRMLYEWDLGDGTFISDTTGNGFDHRYLNRTAFAHDYEASLVAISDYFCRDTATQTVKVYPFVRSGFSMDYEGNCSPLNIVLSNNSIGGSEYIWNFGDGQGIAVNNTDVLSHVFENNSNNDTTYFIQLNTVNPYGCSDSVQRSVFLYPQAVAAFSFTSPDAGCNPLEVSFLNESTGKDLNFLWEFGNNTSSIIENPVPRIFRNSTSTDTVYNVKLTVMNAAGCDSSVTRPIHVYSNVIADFSIAQKDSCSPFIIDVDNLSSGGISEFIWKFTPDDSIILHDFSNPEIPVYQNTSLNPQQYEIQLIARNIHACSSQKSEIITIFPEIHPTFTTDISEGCQPLNVNFTNQTNIISGTLFSWNFDDGTSSSALSPVHNFVNLSRTEYKDFNVQLNAVSSYGCSGSFVHTITVNPKPLADFTYPTAVACPPFDVQFTNESYGTNLSYLWDFDNGHSANDENPQQTFHNYGSTTENMNVSLIVTNTYNCSDTVVKVVGVFPGVSVDFEASSWNGCNPLEVDFTGSAINENEYYWMVDGNVISNSQNPHYRFLNTSGSDKIFDVQFRAVSVNGCSDDTSKHITVYSMPQALFTPDPQIQDFNIITDITRVNFNNNTANRSSWNYEWNFGDGTFSTQPDATLSKDYLIWGDINNDNRIPVELVAVNPAHTECSDTITQYVIINPPVPQVELGGDISGCMPLTVDFSSIAKYNYNDSYQWDFGYNGATSAAEEPAPFTYDTAGVYIVRLSVDGDGGNNWDYKKITVHPKPLADFTFSPDYVWVRSQNEDGTPVKFFNTTQQGFTYLWEFGDGDISNEFQPQHEYMQTGEYYVTLIAGSVEGCYDTLTHELPVIVDGRGYLSFPNAITLFAGNPADEYYNPNEPDPRIFRPVSEGVEEYRMEIYNRWGELIFVSEDVNRGWNGLVKGTPVKQDVYVWRVTARFSNGKPFVKAGDLTVLVKP